MKCVRKTKSFPRRIPRPSIFQDSDSVRKTRKPESFLETEADIQEGTDVFISYSRRDQEFVRWLNERFQEDGRQPWIDWSGIEAGEEWWPSILRGIDAAETFIFVLGPDSIASPVCRREIDRAAASGKRMIPVVCRDIKGIEVHPELAKLNYIFLRTGEERCTELPKLFQALDADLAHVRAHTKFLIRAREWEARGRKPAYLLRGGLLQEADSWLSRVGAKEPPPTELHSDHILASRAAAKKRQRTTMGVIIGGAVVALTLAVAALWAFNQAEQRRLEAEANLRGAESGRLTIQAKLDLERAPAVLPYAMWLGVQARALQPSIENYTLLQIGSDLLPYRKSFWKEPSHSQFDAVAIAPNGDLIVRIGARIERRAADTGELKAVIFTPQSTPEESNVPRNAQPGVLDGTGTRAAIVEPDNTVKIISLPDGADVLELAGDVAESRAIGLDYNGKYLVHINAAQEATIWSAATGEPTLAQPVNLKPLSTPELNVQQVAVDFSGQLIAFSSGSVAGRNYRVWVVDVHTGEVVRSMLLNDMVDFVGFNPSGNRLVASAAGTFYLVDLFDQKPPVRYPSGRSMSDSATFDESGRFMATLSLGPTVRVWDTESPGEVARLNHEGTAYAVAFGSDATTLIVVGDTTGAEAWEASTSVWDLSVTERMREVFLVASDFNSRSSVPSPNGEYAVISDDISEQVRVHDLVTGELLSTMDYGAPSMATIHGSPAQLTMQLDDEIATFSLPDLQLLQTYPRPEEFGGISALSPDGSYYSTRYVRREDNEPHGERSEVVILRVSDQQQVIRHEFDGSANLMVFSPNNRFLAVAVLKRFSPDDEDPPPNELLLFDLDSGNEPVARIDYPGWSGGVSFSRDSLRLAVSGGTSLLVLEIPTLAVVHEIPEELGHDTVDLHPSGKLVATYSRDDFVRVHRLSDGSEVARRQLPRTAFGDAQLHFVNEGRTVAVSADSAGGLFVWDWSVEGIMEELCSRLSHDFEKLSLTPSLTRNGWREVCPIPQMNRQRSNRSLFWAPDSGSAILREGFSRAPKYSDDRNDVLFQTCYGPHPEC